MYYIHMYLLKQFKYISKGELFYERIRITWYLLDELILYIKKTSNYCVGPFKSSAILADSYHTVFCYDDVTTRCVGTTSITAFLLIQWYSIIRRHLP